MRISMNGCKFATYFSALVSLSLAAQLTEEILRYEPLTYDSLDLANQHARYRRDASLTKENKIVVDFYSYGRNLSLVLSPSRSTFHHNAKLELDGKEIPLDTSHLFTGYVKGDSKSYVFGAITSGVFQGRILLGSGEAFHIERSGHYRTNPDVAADPRIHSVIYRDEDVDHDKFFNRKKRSSEESPTCANGHTETSEWMKRVQRSAVVENNQHYHRSHNPYIKRYERQTQTNTATTCHLLMRSDPELWRYYKETFYRDQTVADAQIHEEITALFHNHVQEVHRIYREHPFQNTNGPRFLGYGFRVDRVQIMPMCASSNDDQLCSRNLDATYLLNLHSFADHDKYCLAYLFTYRDFDQGTLGLAWVAEPSSTQGGICARHTWFNNDNGGQTRKSLNTGIVTLENYQKRVPTSVSYITFAHEVGHNFGSPHDVMGQSPSCTPVTDSGSSSGNYIMFASATTGMMTNNKKFSPCSTRIVADVLATITEGHSGKSNCFQAAGGSVCGNQIYESEPDEATQKSEQCDCGFQEDCLERDDCCHCCVGQTTAGTDNACSLKTTGGVECDPSQGPCCSDTCLFASELRMCQPRGQCVAELRCAGDSPVCPNVTANDYNAFNDDPCNDETQVCQSGVCQGSICLLIAGGSWTDCETPPTPNDITLPCFVSCQLPNNGTCYNSADVETDGFPVDFKQMLDRVRGSHGLSLYIPRTPGHICDVDTGFCDHFQKCRKINVQGPLSRLKDLFFSPSTLKLIRDWVTMYWWAVALSGHGFIIIMVLFVKISAAHTPSSNPNAPKARKLSQSLTLRRRQAGQANRQRSQDQPPARPQQVPMLSAQNPQASRNSEQPPPYSSLITREDEISSGPSRGSRPSRQHMEMKEKRKQR